MIYFLSSQSALFLLCHHSTHSLTNPWLPSTVAVCSVAPVALSSSLNARSTVERIAAAGSLVMATKKPPPPAPHNEIPEQQRIVEVQTW
jgi:hypothetical protein